MTSFLSSISGHFGKSLMIGMFAPAVIFVMAARIAFDPLFTAKLWNWEQIFALESGWQLLLFALVALIISLFLFMLNTQILRLFAGYLFMQTQVGMWLVEHEARRHNRLRTQKTRTGILRRVVRDMDTQMREEMQATWSKAGNSGVQDLAGHIANVHQDVALASNLSPSKPQTTRLGNILYAAEEYSSKQYNIEAVLFWPHLTSVMDETFAATVDEAKSQLDFTVNAALLSGALAVITVLVGIIQFQVVVSRPLLLGLLMLETIIFALASCVFYRLALLKAEDWGTTIKTAFDLYRRPLLKKLGYQVDNAPPAYEQQIWSNLADRSLYGVLSEQQIEQDEKGLLSFVESSSQVRLARSVQPGKGASPARIVLQATNSSKKVLNTLVIYDRLPAGMALAHNSARISQGTMAVSGRGLLRFEVNEAALKAGEVLEISYQARPESPG